MQLSLARINYGVYFVQYKSDKGAWYTKLCTNNVEYLAKLPRGKSVKIGQLKKSWEWENVSVCMFVGVLLAVAILYVFS